MRTTYETCINNKKNEYTIQFETGNYKYFKIVEKACRKVMNEECRVVQKKRWSQLTTLGYQPKKEINEGYQPTKPISTQPPNKGSNVQPAAVQPTVIYCKDCKHYATNTELLGNVCTRLFVTLPMNPYDFCSYGERKGE